MCSLSPRHVDYMLWLETLRLVVSGASRIRFSVTVIRSFETSPRSDAIKRDSDERTVYEIVIGVLLALLPESCNPGGVRCIARGAVDSCPSNLHPSESGPVVRIVIDDQCDSWVLVDVPAPAKVFRREALRFFINWCHDLVTRECKANRYDVRSSLGISGG